MKGRILHKVLGLALAISTCVTGLAACEVEGDSSSKNSSTQQNVQNGGQNNSQTGQTCNHVFATSTVVKEASCEENGLIVQVCALCREEVKTTLPMHPNRKTYSAQAATCGEVGWNAYYECIDCGFSTYEEIPATGRHEYENGVCLGCNDGGSGKEPEAPKPGLQAELLDLGEDFRTEYYPVTEELEERQGKIDIAILFDGTAPGWEAVALEYARLHRDKVVITLDKIGSASEYSSVLNYHLTSGNMEWDIVQGNLAAPGYTQRYCLNMYPSVQQKNYYAGDKYWSEVLSEDAYMTNDANMQTYSMNSEGLQTAWFVNRVALEEAGAQGYVNANGEVENPCTWDDLMNLCAKMQEAGYPNPLGISLDNDSVGASQFTWLLRVYGDYYYRNEYSKIVRPEGYTPDLTAKNPEASKNYNPSYAQLFNIILGKGLTAAYVGAESDKFEEFVSQFGKMAPYLLDNAAGKMFSEMREDFQYQKKGKESPQIMLDYVGAGLGFLGSQNDKFKMDFFDYPVMESKYVAENTLLRDVGGAGGYLSIVNHDNEQNALTLDFMKFFMSPYGQTIYYQGLKDANAAPKGLTLVENETVAIPGEWKEFFATDKISYTGNADYNPFIGYFIRGLDNRQNSSDAVQKLWPAYLTGGTVDGQKINLDNFGKKFHDALMADWPEFCKTKTWEEDCYKAPSMYDY